MNLRYGQARSLHTLARLCEGGDECCRIAPSSRGSRITAGNSPIPLPSLQQALLDLALQNSQSHIDGDGSYDGDSYTNDSYIARPPGSIGPNDPLSRLDLAAHLVALIGRLVAARDARLATAEWEMSARQRGAVRQGLGGAAAGGAIPRT